MHRQRMELVGWLLFIGLLLPTSVRADESLRPLGLARVDITPGYPVRMTGYSNRKEEFEGVEQRIWAKALAIDADDHGAAVLITVDSLGVPQEMTDEVAGRLKTKHGIEPRTISFKGVVQTLEAFQPVIALQGEHDPAFRKTLYEHLLDTIALHRVADRPDRYEPRRKKRRPKPYDRLMKPRWMAKRDLRNGLREN